MVADRNRPCASTRNGSSRIPARVRFWRYVDRASDHECWLWVGASNPVNEYGTIHVRAHPDTGQPINAYVHRFSYEMHVGPIPPDMTIDHLCRNKKCVNPDHLEVVTREENSRRGAVAYWSDLGRSGHRRHQGPTSQRPTPPSLGEHLTDTSTRVLMAIIGQSVPSIRSVAAEVGVSASTAHHHIERLQAEGLVTHTPGLHCSLRPTVTIVAAGQVVQ